MAWSLARRAATLAHSPLFSRLLFAIACALSVALLTIGGPVGSALHRLVGFSESPRPTPSLPRVPVAETELDGACLRAQGQQELPWYTDVTAEYSGLLKGVTALRVQKTAILGHNTTLRGLGSVPHQPRNRSELPQPFLFVAVLTTMTSSRRTAVRETWMRQAQGNDVMVRFFLTEEERTPATDEEAAEHGDMVVVRRGSGRGYRSIVYKVFLAVEWLVDNVNPKFVLKTDDDAYVDTAHMVTALKELCQQPNCEDERLYLGMEKRNGEVIMDASNKWSNLEYFKLTGLREYAPYMMGGGYVFSTDVARALVETNAIAPLKFMPNEDATFGFWVMGMNLRRIDHPRAKTAAGHCCYNSVYKEDAVGRWESFRIRQTDPICQQWLILHKVDNNDQMRYIHQRLQQCPEQERLIAMAQKLAVAQEKPVSSIRPLEVFALTDWKAGFHLFGYSDKQQWSADGSMLLGLRTMLSPRDLAIDSRAEIGMIPFSTGRPLSQDRAGWKWVSIGITTAWNFQYGANAQWLGTSNRYMVYNDRQCVEGSAPDDLCAVVYDVAARKRARVLPRPVFTVSPDGALATSVDFIRLQKVRKGFGYESTPQAQHRHAADKCPRNDGLWLVDVATGDDTLLVSLRDLYDAVTGGLYGGRTDPVTGLPYRLQDTMPEAVLTQCRHWVNYPQFNAEGTSLAFLYRVGACPKFYGEYFRTYLFTIDVTGHNLWRVPVAEGSFHDYGAEGRLLVSEKGTVVLVHNRRNATRLHKPPNIAWLGEGKATFSPADNRFVLMDSQKDPMHLIVWDLARNDTLTVGYYAPKDWDGPVHAKAGLMPRWSRDGRFVAFDSAHVWGTGSQMYVAGVQQMKVGWSATAPPAKQAPARRVLLDLAVRSGAALRSAAVGDLGADAVAASFDEIHAFQAAALSTEAQQRLRGLVKQLGLESRLTVHPEAASSAAGNVTVNTAGRSRWDVAVDDIAQLILPHAGDDDWTRWDGRWAPWRPGHAQPPAPPFANVTEFGAYGRDVEIQALDLAAWLSLHVRAADHVAVVMDLEGREFALLSHLLGTDALALVDRLYVHWHLQHLNWEWPLVWEGIFTTLGLDFEVIPRPEAWVLARQTAAKATLSSRAEAVIDPARSRTRSGNHVASS